MDILKPLNNVTSLDEYIAATQDVVKQSKNVKVQINITTVLTLKKIRSFEIQVSLPIWDIMKSIFSYLSNFVNTLFLFVSVSKQMR